jgi:hypothetical protein
MARRPQGHVEDTIHSEKVLNAVRNAERGGEPQHREPRNRAVSPKYGGQDEDQRTSKVSEVSLVHTKMHKGGGTKTGFPNKRCRHVDETKLPLSTENAMADRFDESMQQAMATSLRRPKRSRGDDDTEDNYAIAKLGISRLRPIKTATKLLTQPRKTATKASVAE